VSQAYFERNDNDPKRQSKVMERLDAGNLADDFPNSIKDIGADIPQNEVVDLLDLDQGLRA
jgi:hypothetical protein